MSNSNIIINFINIIQPYENYVNEMAEEVLIF